MDIPPTSRPAKSPPTTPWTRLVAVMIVGLMVLTSCSASPAAAFVAPPSDPVFTALFLEGEPIEGETVASICRDNPLIPLDEVQAREDFYKAMWISSPSPDEDEVHCFFTYELIDFQMWFEVGVNPVSGEDQKAYRKVLNDSGPLDVCEFHASLGADDVTRPDDTAEVVEESTSPTLSEDERTCVYEAENDDELLFASVYLINMTQVVISAKLRADSIEDDMRNEFGDLSRELLEVLAESL